MTRARRALLVAAATAAMAAGACSDDAPSTLDPSGSEAEELAGLWWLLFGLGAFVYLVVAGLVVFASLRGRRRGSGRSLPENRFIWIGGVAAPLVILLVLAVATVESTADLRGGSSPDDLRIEVEGADWFWNVRYPEAGVATANEIRVPVGRPVEIILTSRDVIHSFWVPQLAGKVDLVPGQTNTLRFTVEDEGVYKGQCAEYCGIQHAHMRLLVIAEPEVDFERWLTRRQAPPGEPTSDLAVFGRRVFEREACAGCHTIRGTAADGTLGPDLSDVGARRTLGAGTVPNTVGHLSGWIADAQSIKPGSLMPPMSLSPRQLEAVVAYLRSLE